MRPTRWMVLAAAALTTAVVSTSPESGFVGSAAQAQDVDIKVGAQLAAIQSVSLDEAVIAVGEQVSVTATQVKGGALFVDVALADGHVVKAVPIADIRKSFRVVA